MRIALIGCMVMNREISHLVSESRHIVRTWWLRQGLHDTPDVLHEELQRLVDEVEMENGNLAESLRFDRIVLAYGLCSNGVLGLRSRTLPIVVPRCDDCISLFLGSAERYRQLFRELPGIYWYTDGWIEHAVTPSKENEQKRRESYVETYGEENADYLMECTGSWIGNYFHCGYITCPLKERPAYKAYAQQAANDFNWKFCEIPGDMSYMDALVNGPWDEERFLTCPPGHRIEPDYTDRKFRSMPCGADDREM